MSDLNLTPLLATIIFAIGCVCGMRYRAVWKAEGPRWQLWLYGVGAALCLLVVGFVPLRVGS